MNKFIDIHTHKQKDPKSIEVLINNPGSYFVAGIHPWFLDEFIEHEYKSIMTHPNYMGMGEIGLDKLRDNYSKQIELFEKQVYFAKKYRINFLVLHNIKSNEEILRVLQNYKGKVLFHDFNQSYESFLQLDNKLDIFVSTGKRFTENSKTQNLYKKLPIRKVFLETDDSILSIKDVYTSYSNIQNIPLKELQRVFLENFTNLLKSINMSIHY